MRIRAVYLIPWIAVGCAIQHIYDDKLFYSISVTLTGVMLTQWTESLLTNIFRKIRNKKNAK